MKLLLKVLAGIVVLLLVIVAGVYLWAGSAANRVLSQTFQVHAADFPIPFPLDPAEVATLGLTEEAARQVALERAVERGKHLVTARYPCRACHGENFGGGTMIDAFPIGKLLGPNLTTGTGSRTLQYTPADWDHIVRHGVLPDGTPAVMPSEDFLEMSDQELSDIVSYIRSLPAVDNTVPAPSFGPLGKFLVATGELKPAATVITHASSHKAVPPAPTPTADFGKHLAGTCVGCHRTDFSGGPIPGGDPSWPPARNITPAPGALAGWTYEHFTTLVRDGKRPDGTAILDPMTLVLPYLRQATDTELQALFAYLQSLPPVPVQVQQ
jgi:mono/diheme cytochrome c family protein